MRTLLLALTLMLSAPTAMSQTPASPRPCTAPEHRQFDFWIGRWNVFTPDGEQAGVNVIEAIDGGCVLIERWSGKGGFSGTSLNSWDRASGQWRQHWVDNQGGMLRLAGRFENGSMVLGSNQPDTGVLQRITWTLLPDGAVRQHWETSRDEGRSWSTAFDGRYVKARP
jgi:hypothetical protein